MAAELAGDASLKLPPAHRIGQLRIERAQQHLVPYLLARRGVRGMEPLRPLRDVGRWGNLCETRVVLERERVRRRVAARLGARLGEGARERDGRGRRGAQAEPAAEADVLRRVDDDRAAARLARLKQAAVE